MSLICSINHVRISVEHVVWSFYFYYRSECRLQGMGFERGWGDTAERVLEMMHLLLDILQAPDPSTLETFLGRVPMVFNVVILSPHGYFGQANVLGLPDTGGQVIDVLVQHKQIWAGQLDIFSLCPFSSSFLLVTFKLLSCFDLTYILCMLTIRRLFIYWIKCVPLRMRCFLESRSKDWISLPEF